MIFFYAGFFEPSPVVYIINPSKHTKLYRYSVFLSSLIEGSTGFARMGLQNSVSLVNESNSPKGLNL